MAVLHPTLWRSRARLEDDWSPSATGHRRSLCSSRTFTWTEPHSHPGIADRIGVQVGTEDSSHESRRKLDGMGGCRPLGTTTKFEEYQCRRFSNYTADHTYQGEKAEDDTGVGPGGRDGVHSGARVDEINMDPESDSHHGWLPATRRRADIRTAIGHVQANGHPGYVPLRRLWSLRSIWIEGSESKQISHLRLDLRRLRDERVGWPCQLHPMESLFQSLWHGVDDAEHRRSSSTTCLRSLCRETRQELPNCLAFDLCCRGPGKEWAGHEDEDVDRHGDLRWRHPTKGLGDFKAVEHGVEEIAERIGLLEGAGAQPSSLLVGTWWTRTTEDTDRVVRHRPLEGRPGSSTTYNRRRRGESRHSQEGFKQSQKRSKKEEVGLREGGARKLQKTWSRKERRKRERQQRKRWKRSRAKVLWVEQWKWALRFFGTWSGVRVEGEASTSLHHLQFARPPVEKLPAEEVAEPHEPQEGAGDSRRSGKGEKRPLVGATSRNKSGKGENEEDPGEDGGSRGGGRSDDGDFRPPERPQEAATEEEYLEGRTFLFVHHYSGCEQDVLAQELTRAAEIEGVKLKVVSIDKEAGTGDLLLDSPYREHLQWAQNGWIDGFHAGFPCTTFSRLRWRISPGYPGPVRSKLCPYGLASNTPAQQEECDRGTIMAARSVNIAKEVEAHKKPGEVIGPFSTLENPPESNHNEHLSAWELSEVKEYTDLVGILNANFHTCAYQQKLAKGQRNLKPQRIAGSLLGIGKLARFCTCLVELGHVPVIGKEASKAAAVYPRDFCEAYASLAMRHFKKMAAQEFLKLKMTSARKEVEDLQEKAERRRKRKRRDEDAEDDPHRKEPLRLVEWKGGQGPYEILREDKKKTNKPDQMDFVGGMRDPIKTVERHPAMLNFGKDMNVVWTEFARENPEVLEVAKRYGTEKAEFNIELVLKWKKAMKKIFGIEEAVSHAVKSEEYKSPLDADVLEAWADLSGDPEKEVPNWIRHGAPLGIAEQIRTCGIFPPNTEEEGDYRPGALLPEELQDAEAQLSKGEILNYKTVEEDKQEAKIELDKYHQAGYTRYYTENEVKERFSAGTISRLGLIVKVKESGVKNRRIILDLRRSGGNAKATLPEKLVLPRPRDAIEMFRNLHSRERGAGDMELVVIDISDAFMALPVCQQEHQHALAPALERGQFIAFVALLFGYKVAPLLWSRVASLMSRLLQAAIPGHQGQHQCYLDDSLWALRGALEERNHNLSFILYSMAAVGFKVALSKGERANAVQWIGVRLAIIEKDIVLTLPENFVKELIELLASWTGKGMVPLKELRKAAGKLQVCCRGLDGLCRSCTEP